MSLFLFGSAYIHIGVHGWLVGGRLLSFSDVISLVTGTGVFSSLVWSGILAWVDFDRFLFFLSIFSISLVLGW